MEIFDVQAAAGHLEDILQDESVAEVPAVSTGQQTAVTL